MGPAKSSRKGRPKQPSPKGRQTTSEPLVRRVQISGCRTQVAVNVDTPWLEPPRLDRTSRIEIRGTMDEPIQSVGDVVIQVYPSELPVYWGSTQTPSVGNIVEIRPRVVVLVPLPPSEFDHTWSLALQGWLRHAHFVCTKPRHNQALVTALSFSNEPILPNGDLEPGDE